MDLTTVARVNARRGQGAADDSTLLDELIDEVSADVEAYLNRHVQATSRTERYRLDYNQRDFRVDGYPITSVASVSVSPDLDFNASEVLSATAYYVQTTEGRLHLVSYAAWQPTWVEVQYTGGMAADTATFVSTYPDIAGAVDAAVIELFKRSDKPGVSETRLRDGGVMYERPVNMLPLLKRRLDQHKRTVIL